MLKVVSGIQFCSVSSSATLAMTSHYSVLLYELQTNIMTWVYFAVAQFAHTYRGLVQN